jgi:hypothetical protein
VHIEEAVGEVRAAGESEHRESRGVDAVFRRDLGGHREQDLVELDVAEAQVLVVVEVLGRADARGEERGEHDGVGALGVVDEGLAQCLVVAQRVVQDDEQPRGSGRAE